MSKEADFQWISGVLEEKTQRGEEAATRKKGDGAEAMKYDALINDFWKGIKVSISDAVTFFNSHVLRDVDYFTIEPSGNDALQIKKTITPLADATITLNRPSRRVSVSYSLPRASPQDENCKTEKQFVVRVAADSLLLEDTCSGKQVAKKADIAAWLLVDFFRKA